MKSIIHTAARALCWALVGALLCGSVSSCELAGYKKRKEELKKKIEKERKEEEEVAPNRRSLEVGETVVHKFAGDNFWHPAPYAFDMDQVIDIKTHGPSKRLAPAVVEYRVGSSIMVISTQSQFRVSEPGAVAFRLDPLKAGTYKGECEVEITRKK